MRLGDSRGPRRPVQTLWAHDRRCGSLPLSCTARARKGGGVKCIYRNAARSGTPNRQAFSTWLLGGGCRTRAGARCAARDQRAADDVCGTAAGHLHPTWCIHALGPRGSSPRSPCLSIKSIRAGRHRAFHIIRRTQVGLIADAAGLDGLTRVVGIRLENHAGCA